MLAFDAFAVCSFYSLTPIRFRPGFRSCLCILDLNSLRILSQKEIFHAFIVFLGMCKFFLHLHAFEIVEVGEEQGDYKVFDS